MEKGSDYLRKLVVAGVGAAELGYEKLGQVVDECVKRGEVTVEKGRALNEELKHKRAESAPADSEKSDINVEELSAEQRAKLLEKLLSMQEEKK